MLEKVDPRAARVMKLRFFGGLEETEIAEVVGISAMTVKRDWKTARAWLLVRLQRKS
jgi:RNA polymerase sigma factor (sigma-70 family)